MTSPGFQGNLVAADADVPAHLGLHHHGDEPGRAGYSLEELFQLSRSSNLQQRVMSLNTLANVIHQVPPTSHSCWPTSSTRYRTPPLDHSCWWSCYTINHLYIMYRIVMAMFIHADSVTSYVQARHGAYHQLTSKPLLPVLMDGGLLFIVRWALDDSADSSVAAAVNCLHRLLVCETDEQALDATYHW